MCQACDCEAGPDISYEVDETEQDLATARYQIERAIAQLRGTDPENYPDDMYDVVDSVVAQLKAYLEA